MQYANVPAAAVATRGLCADVLRAVLAEHKMVICPQIVSEFQRVLKDKFALPGPLINDYVRLIQQDSIPCEPGGPPVTKLKDKDDLGILSAAIGGKVDVRVTGDKELQRVGMVAAVRIMSPREFWQDLVESG
ncbi:MAG TPA: PIN domain-containing protein [Desulfobacterales bacterium]|nr:PIN domain-containing protein [Desulfobacterales bacterium]